MKLTCLRSAATWMMSPVKSAPLPPAPPAQCRTVPPSKWQPQPVERGPVLPRRLDVLALVLADVAGGGRLLRLGVLRAAGGADEVRHGGPPAGHSIRGPSGRDRTRGDNTPMNLTRIVNGRV